MQVKPFSQSCENNKNPIYAILAPHLEKISQVVEIGSGTGQHACYFTEQLPHLTWQTTDQGEYFPQLEKLIAEQNSSCLPPSLQLDVSQPVWPISDCEFVLQRILYILCLGIALKNYFRGSNPRCNLRGIFTFMDRLIMLVSLPVKVIKYLMRILKQRIH